MKTVEVACEKCNKVFLRKEAEVKRNLTKNRRVFCSRSCSSATLIKSNLGDKFVGRPEHLLKGKVRDEYSDFKYFIRKAKARARSCGIDVAYLKELWDRQEGKCALTGFPLAIGRKVPNHMYEASLDRIDSSIGYEEGNVQFVCLILNYAKNSYSNEEVKRFIERLKS